MNTPAGDIHWKRFDALTCELETPALRREVFDALAARYAEPHRHYHTLDHIVDCLAELDRARADGRDAMALELAIWFHDSVYDATRPDNEARSADVADAALARLGMDEGRRAEIRRLILLTRHQSPPDRGDRDGCLMVDIDLAPLGAPPDVFDANGRALRREFAHLDDADYIRGRDTMLRRLLDRPRIYCTPRFADRYEQSARSNLLRTVQGGGNQKKRTEDRR